ncbi:MAG: hypothetical protein FWE74_08555 [Oscillospiraceae bacterium]|nr:hypothetical protein [Oscillospiraceae bacterium]
MLKQINLDDRSYDELLKEAVEQIPKYCDGWTDFNAHDPGITFLELFAWLTEQQRYHLNRITDEHRLKYLKLLGVAPRAAIPAKLPVVFESANGFIPEGTIASIGGARYLTQENIVLNDCKMFLYRQGRDSWVSEDSFYGFTPFGSGSKPPKSGDCFFLRLSAAATEPLQLYFRLVPQNRVPMREGYCPIAVIRVDSVLEKRAYHCKIKDETYGFTQSGYIIIEPPFASNLLRISLTYCESAFQLKPPVFEWISARYSELIQHEDCNIGVIKEEQRFCVGDYKAGNPLPSYGGSEAESVAQAFARVREEMQTPYRAVTLEDYAELVRLTPGTCFESVNISSPALGKINISVSPVCEAYKKNIRRFLFNRKLPCAEIVFAEPALGELLELKVI